MAQHFLTGLDLGTQNIKAIVVEIGDGNRLVVSKILKMPAAGMRKGTVDDLGEATRGINEVISDLKHFNKAATRNIFLSVGASDVKVHQSQGIVAVSRADSEIQQEDVRRAIEASRALKLPNNRMILHTITKEFIVDGVSDVRDPLGMIGNRLEVQSFIVDAFEPNIKNLMKCVEITGGGIGGLVFSPLAAARAVLSKNQRELGVALVDIGAGKTGLVVYEENKLVHAKVFPFGSGHITNDLAIGLRTSIHAAENIKLSLGLAVAKEAPRREQIDLSTFDTDAKKAVPRKTIASIIEDRLAEIFEYVNNELKAIGKAAKLPAGIVLTGGGSKIPMIVDLAKREFRLGAQIGLTDLSPFQISGAELTAEAEDPEFTSAFGLILSQLDQEGEYETKFTLSRNFLKRFLKNFIP